MTLVCELPSILQDINDKNELINYGETWRKLHAKVPPPLNQGDSLASRGAQDDKSSKRTGTTGSQLRPTTSSILQPTHDSRSGIPLAHRNSEPVLGHGSSAAKGRGVASKDRKDTEDDNFHLLSVTAAYLPTMLAKRHEHSNGQPISRTTTSRRRPPLTSAANAALLQSVPPQLGVDDSDQDDPNSPSDPMRTVSPSPWGNDDYDMPLSAMYSTHSVQMAIAKTIPDTSVPNRLSQPSETERQWTAALRDQEELALLEQRKATTKNDREAALQAQHLFILQQLQHLQEQQHRLLQQFQDIQLTYQAEFHQPLQLPKTMPLPNLPPLVLPSAMGKKFPHIVVGSHGASAGIGSHGRIHSIPAQHLDEIPRLAYPVLKAHHLPLPKPIFHASHPSPRDLLPKASSKSELKAKLEGSEKSHHKASTLPSTHPTGSMHKSNSDSRVKNPGQEDESSEDEVGTRSRQHVTSRGGAHTNSSEHGADANSRDPHNSSTRYTSAQQQEMQRGAHQQQVQHGNHNTQAAANQQQQQQLQAQYARQQQYAATAVAPVPHPHQPPPQQTQYNGRARLVFFTQHNEGPITTVHKEVAHYPAPRESGLSRLFAIVEVYVFVPHRKKPLVLRVPQTTNFGQLSAVAIKTRNSTPKLPPTRRLEENPDAYYVRIAGRNGQPDERYPGVLSKRNGNIESWLRFAFCLVENPEYKARMTEPPQEQKVHLTVFLPSGSYNVLLVDANTKMKKVLQMICAKRQLTAANFMLMVEQMSYESDSQSESDVGELEWQSIPGSVRVGDLESTAVTLVQKTGVATLQGEEAWYTGFAAQQKTYSHIIFLKKKNLGSSSKEKSASLDIDQDSITVTVIRKKRQPKTFKVPFETIVAVHQSENKPTQFHIECQDHRTLMFEAPNPVMAKEIIFRIQFLIDMESEARALAMANPVN